MIDIEKFPQFDQDKLPPHLRVLRDWVLDLITTEGGSTPDVICHGVHQIDDLTWLVASVLDMRFPPVTGPDAGVMYDISVYVGEISDGNFDAMVEVESCSVTDDGKFLSGVDRTAYPVLIPDEEASLVGSIGIRYAIPDICAELRAASP
ncbi:hypothetical protein KA093_01510 [Candidatus Saccharibacteria bacterium]|nr:hypothetical protein [Candidatus Saccharibacteria bacterium]